ncbi:hypothetical protein KDAU_00580 [Dictyobacter aurantiacus]|uniref:Uncharacterized protein n=1 Tax=Dictyobacter aurantiacus TaxID=1936993 RepID=A0A401Z7B4_9CHLR|nr:hypothetical protein KDAU_00580 [Dictyobacter aurantiacus]
MRDTDKRKDQDRKYNKAYMFHRIVTPPTFNITPKKVCRDNARNTTEVEIR